MQSLVDQKGTLVDAFKQARFGLRSTKVLDRSCLQAFQRLGTLEGARLLPTDLSAKFPRTIPQTLMLALDFSNQDVVATQRITNSTGRSAYTQLGVVTKNVTSATREFTDVLDEAVSIVLSRIGQAPINGIAVIWPSAGIGYQKSNFQGTSLHSLLTDDRVHNMTACYRSNVGKTVLERFAQSGVMPRFGSAITS